MVWWNGLLNLAWWQTALAALALTHVTIAAVTIYLHRHQAHRGLELHAIPSHFFRFWLWMTTGMITKEWVGIHRKHHAKCETAEDPHSPQVLGIKKVFWEGAELYRAASKQTDEVNKYSHGAPNDWVEKNVYTKLSRYGIVLMLLVNVLLFGALGITVWAVQMAWIPITAAGVINGLGHYIGYRNFECEDASTNLVPWGILIGGEELHNNHHTFGTSAKLSNKWYEFDIGWFYIRCMEIVGLAKVLRVAPEAKLLTSKVECDASTLQAIITNRYTVATHFAKTLKATCTEELHRLHSSAMVSQHGISVSRLRRALHRDAKQVTEADQAALNTALSQSEKLHTIYTMRQELTTLWERSSASKEQLLSHLQDWCHRAEASGIHALQEFAKRLRQYA